jgi:hypothetical protein
MLLLEDNNIMWYCNKMRKRIPVKQQQEHPRRYRYIDQKFTVLICQKRKMALIIFIVYSSNISHYFYN